MPMKICGIKFINHPVLGSLELDFTVEGKPADTVYLIGENGAGKTTILKEIESISSNTNYPSKTAINQKIIYSISLEGKDIKRLFSVDEDQFNDKSFYPVKIIIDKNKTGWDAIRSETTGEKESFANHGSMWKHEVKKELLRVNYFESSPGYEYSSIRTTTSLDINPKEIKISNYKEIAQLLVDIQSQDDSDFSTWSRENPELSRSAYQIETRTERFARAFNEIFEKKYHGLVTENGEKKIQFKDGDKICDIGTLSSGEKQIALRACNLLRSVHDNAKITNLLDEPEVSLHPSLQLKIMQFYKSLFSNNGQKFSGQFIVSTHSPFILDQINQYTDKVIHIERKNGNTETKRVANFFGWHDKKIITESFKVDTSLFGNGFKVLLEGETDEKYFKAAQKFLNNRSINIEYKWVGRTIKTGHSEFTGDKALNQTLAFACAHPDNINGKLVLLYDNDTNKPPTDFEKVMVRRLPDPQAEGKIRKGIESLLDISSLTVPMQDFWKTEEIDDGYGAISVINKLNKMKLCNHICSLESGEMQKEILAQIITFMQQLEDQIIKS